MARDGETFAARPDPVFEPGNPPEPVCEPSEEDQLVQEFELARYHLRVLADVADILAMPVTGEQVTRLTACIERIQGLVRLIEEENFLMKRERATRPPAQVIDPT